IQDVLDRNDPEALRYFLLGTHYRGPLAFDMNKEADGRVVFTGVDEAERRVDYLYTTLDSLRKAAGSASPGGGPHARTEGESTDPIVSAPAALKAQSKVVAGARDAVLGALDKDLSTPQALAVLADLAKAGNEIATFATKKKDDAARALAAAAADALVSSCVMLGLLEAPTETFFARTRERRMKLRSLDAAAIDAKVRDRDAARAAKDFARADAIRKELAATNVELLDAESATTWRVLQ
ncbi:MAG TPA: DALR domain-containing protein, partial [Polyangiaceae bacterium]|nr:DALR domain-containing protein [Polyangiaceae bacterium]